MHKGQHISESCVFSSTSASEILSIVNGLKTSESVGIDEISTKFLKQTISTIALPFSNIINACISRGTFPDNMKLARVTPIYKSGSREEFSNYRPISILNSFSKVFEKVIVKRLLSFISKHLLLSNAQFGFRQNHSTNMAMMNLFDKVTEAIDNNDYCVGVFIDLSKAFDTLNHEILLRKLEFYGTRGLPNLLLKVI